MSVVTTMSEFRLSMDAMLLKTPSLEILAHVCGTRAMAQRFPARLCTPHHMCRQRRSGGGHLFPAPDYSSESNGCFLHLSSS